MMRHQVTSELPSPQRRDNGDDGNDHRGSQNLAHHARAGRLVGVGIVSLFRLKVDRHVFKRRELVYKRQVLELDAKDRPHHASKDLAAHNNG